eukprot:1044856-Rhodomonas_salina.1
MGLGMAQIQFRVSSSLISSPLPPSGLRTQDPQPISMTSPPRAKMLLTSEKLKRVKRLYFLR